MKKYILNILFLLSITCAANAQYANVYPTNWWTGMQWNKVQLLVHGTTTDFNKQDVSISYPGVTLQKINRLENGKYFALDILITAAAKPGIVKINFKNGSKTNTIEWPLNKRREGRGT